MKLFIGSTQFNVPDENVLFYNEKGIVNSSLTAGRVFDKVYPDNPDNFKMVAVRGIKHYYNNKYLFNSAPVKNEEIKKDQNIVKIRVGSQWFEYPDDQIKSWDSDGNIEWSDKIHWKFLRGRPKKGDEFIYDEDRFILFEGELFNKSLNYDKYIELYFNSLIEGKRVIYVGPSPILEGRGMGKFIDSFDVVVRSNASYPVPEHLWEDYGSRCDILYTNVFYSKIINKLQNKDIYKNILICSKVQKIDNIKNRIFELKETEYLIHNKVHLTGNYTYLDILEKNPYLLYITGISLYLDNRHHLEDFEYRDDNQKQFYKFHDHVQEVSLFKNVILNKENVRIDNFLIDLIKNNNLINE